MGFVRTSRLVPLADVVWTSYGGRQDLPKTGVVIEFTDSLSRVGSHRKVPPRGLTLRGVKPQHTTTVRPASIKELPYFAAGRKP